MDDVKPAPGLDISTPRAAVLDGDNVEPLSKLAAQNENERAERFTFRDEDAELLQQVLAADNDQHTGEPVAE